jgi:predicted negative regulator of RcsB-dependent stress response
MPRNTLYLVVAVLIALSAGLGYALYQEQQQKASIEIKVGPRGLAIETK